MRQSVRDPLGLSREVCADVFRRAEKYGVAEENILIVSIHTHTGPCIKYHEGCGYPSDAYVAAVAQHICKAVDAAYADMDNVDTLQYVRAPFDGDHIYNRTIENGPADRFVRSFTLSRKAHLHRIDQRGLPWRFPGIVIAVSADFAGEICRMLDAKGTQTIYLNGLCSDIDPTRNKDDLLHDSFAMLVADQFLSKKANLPLTLSGATYEGLLSLSSFAASLGCSAESMDLLHRKAAECPEEYSQALDRAAKDAADMLYNVLWVLDPSHIIIECRYASMHQEAFIAQISARLAPSLTNEQTRQLLIHPQKPVPAE